MLYLNISKHIDSIKSGQKSQLNTSKKYLKRYLLFKTWYKIELSYNYVEFKYILIYK